MVSLSSRTEAPRTGVFAPSVFSRSKSTTGWNNALFATKRVDTIVKKSRFVAWNRNTRWSRPKRRRLRAKRQRIKGGQQISARTSRAYRAYRRKCTDVSLFCISHRCSYFGANRKDVSKKSKFFNNNNNNNNKKKKGILLVVCLAWLMRISSHKKSERKIERRIFLRDWDEILPCQHLFFNHTNIKRKNWTHRTSRYHT